MATEVNFLYQSTALKYTSCIFLTASHHGTKGPMSVEKSRHTTWLLQAFLAAASTLGYPIRDPNGFQDQSGFSPYLFNIQNGQRASTADAYLRPALKRDNLDIVLNTHVRKILFDDNKRAIGIEATQNHGYSVFEVIFYYFQEIEESQIFLLFIWMER